MNVWHLTPDASRWRDRMIHSRVTTTPLADIIGTQKPIDPELFALAKDLEK